MRTGAQKCWYKGRGGCANDATTFLRLPSGALQPVCAECDAENGEKLRAIANGVLNRKHASE